MLYITIIFFCLYLIAGIKIARAKETIHLFSFDLQETLPLRGLLAVCVFLTHLCPHLDDASPWLGDFGMWGPPSVATFFLLAGYGLAYSVKTKGQDYLKGFFRKRLMKLLWPFLMMAIIFQGYKMAMGTFTWSGFVLEPSPMSWFIYALLIWYVGFYVCFKNVHSYKNAIGRVWLFTVIYMKWKDLMEETAGGGRGAREENGKLKSKASLQNGRNRSRKQPSLKRTIITRRKETLEEEEDPAELERRQKEQEKLEQEQRDQQERERKQREFEERERQRAAYERMEQLEYQKEMQDQAKQASEDVRETLQKKEPSVVRKTTLTREVQQTSEDAMIQAQEKMRQSVQLARRTPMKDPTRQIPDVDKESVFRPMTPAAAGRAAAGVLFRSS